MAETIQLSDLIPARPEEIYRMWLNSEGHAKLTGSPAEASPLVGSAFTAWDGYISGKTVGLEPNRRILQLWRTTEFPADSPDSRLEILLELENDSTRVTFKHTNIPDGQGGSYRQGWIDSYFTPMKKHFGG
jgi:activator of HSP90 ATPase